MKKEEKKKCEVCGRKAIFRFSPDLDIEGFGACKKHKTEVRTAYIALMTSGEEMFKMLSKNWDSNRKTKVFRRLTKKL